MRLAPNSADKSVISWRAKAGLGEGFRAKCGRRAGEDLPEMGLVEVASFVELLWVGAGRFVARPVLA